MTDFKDLWALLYDHGASARKEEGTRRYWATLTPEQQDYAFTSISKKLDEGKFVQYDPIRAIRENLPREAKAEPTNYNGRSLPAEATGTAFYNGKWGIYTVKDIEKYGLRTPVSQTGQ